MRNVFLRGAAFAIGSFFCAVTHAQTVSTTSSRDDERDDPLAFPAPAEPLLSFVSPDASLVARPGETPAATPQESAAPVAQIAVETAPDGNAAAETTFATIAPQIVIRWHGENLRVGSSVRVAWVADDVGGIVDPGFVIDRFSTEVETTKFGAHFTVSRPRDGWAAGKYRVEVFVDDELKATLGVTIRE